MSGGLLVTLLLAAQPVTTEALLNLYRTANAYQTAATRRSCADASLGTRLAATGQRMDRARSRMTARFGEERLRGSEPPMLSIGDICADPVAAANSLANFDVAVARLEAALARAPAASPAQANTAVAVDEHRFTRLFFYRLQFFHATAAEQNCMRAHPERTRALDARYDALERRVIPLLGRVSPYSSGGYRRDGFDDDCGRGIILRGYENALGTLELHLAEAAR